MTDKHTIDDDREHLHTLDLDEGNDELEDDEELSLHERRRAKRVEEVHLNSRQRLREELSNQVEEFLARGGRIHEIPSRIGMGFTNKVGFDFGNRPM